MATRKRPYYALHQIETGKYTKGGELFREDGTPYVGPYHILPNGWYYSGFVPLSDSIELFESKPSDADPIYTRLTKVETGNYLEPVYVRPKPEAEDYNNGYMNRYFVQKRNNPISSIVEISKDQFDSVNRTNGPGINAYLWRRIEIPWRIRGKSINEVSDINLSVVKDASKKFIGIGKYLINLIEFYN